MNGLACLSLAVAAQLGVAAARADERTSLAAEFPEGRLVQYGFTVKNTSNCTLTNAQVWTYAPLRLTAHQQRRDMQCSHPYELVDADRGNQVLHFSLPSMAPGAADVIRISVLLGMRTEPLPELAPQQADLSAEPNVEIEDPAFLGLAPRFAVADARALARTIFAWTIGHMTSARYVRRDMGAMHALRTGEGDCTEYACLFVALCRLHQVPARMVGGYRTSGGVLNPDAYHNWAEFHDGRTWRVVDPLARSFDRHASSYVALSIGGSRVSPVNPQPQFRGDGAGLMVTMNGP